MVKAHDRVRIGNEAGTVIPVDAAPDGRVRVRWDNDPTNPRFEPANRLVIIPHPDWDDDEWTPAEDAA